MTDQPSAAPRLAKDVGALQFFTLAFGAVVGAGWAVVLGDWLRQGGPLGAMLALAAGGVFVILIGLCYGEMAALFPVSGGEIAFAYEVFGQRTCFAVGWLLALAYTVVTSFEAISIAWIMSALVPGMEGPVLYRSLGTDVRAGSLALGLLMMGILTVLNYRGVKAATRAQDALIIALLLAAVVFIATGIVRGDPANLQPYFQRNESGSVWPGLLAIFMTASFWFGGFEVAPKAMEERTSGTRLGTIGRMIVLSIVIGIVFKTMVILSASMTIPWRELVTAPVPVATAFRTAFRSELLAKLVLVTALLGLLSTWNSVLMAASRIFFSLGRAGFLSPRFAAVHARHGSPAFAVLFTGAIGALGTLLGRNAIIPIVNMSATCLTIAYMLTCLALIRLRRTAPERERPFRTPGGVVTAGIAVAGAAFSFGLSIYQPYADARGRLPLEWVMLVVWGALGALFWRTGRGVRTRMPETERRRSIMGAQAASSDR